MYVDVYGEQRPKQPNSYLLSQYGDLMKSLQTRVKQVHILALKKCKFIFLLVRVCKQGCELRVIAYNKHCAPDVWGCVYYYTHGKTC